MIETATRAHGEVLADIHRAAFPVGEAWSRDVMSLQLELPSTFGFIHSLGGMILGRVAADESEILTLAVVAGQRRLGIGSALLRAAMARGAVLGAVSMFLEVSVMNEAARGLYAAHGFVRAGLRRGYYVGGADALILRSTLGAGAAES
jgi:ribosomal-protein-alanine N-acetyltransferase